MKVVREKPCRRRHLQVTAPLFVITADNQRYQATNWSVGGLRIDGWEEELPAVGDVLELHLELPFQGFDIGFDVEMEVVRITAEQRTVAGKFAELGEREKDIMSFFVEEIVRGHMSDVGGTIARIDIPVTPISTKPDPNPTGEIPVRRWDWKPMMMVAIYTVLGVIVFGYVGAMLYANFFKLEVRSAVVSVPMETSKTPVDGRIANILVKLDEWVEAGSLVVDLRNPELESNLDAARLRLNQARDDHQRLVEQRLLEVQRLQEYRKIDETEVALGEARAQGHREILKAAVDQQNRIRKLLKKGYATPKDLGVANEKVAKAKSDLRVALLQTDQQRLLLKSSLNRHHNGKEFISDLGRLDLELSAMQSQIDLSLKQVQVLEEHRKRLSIRAPFNGRVTAILRQPGAALIRGEPVIVFEQTDRPVIDAFLNQEEVLEVGLGDEAYIYMPALDQEFQVMVVEIDRTTGFVDEQQSQYIWRGPNDRSARVKLQLDPFEDLQHVKAGIPVIVMFDRRSVNAVVASVKRLFRGQLKDHESQNQTAEIQH